MTGVLAGALTPAALAHTLYPQWVAYRRKHLLIGCHRKDNETYLLAERLVAEINHALPKAKARAARAPHPQRLASLIGTDQMEVAVLGRDEALEMRAGQGRFAPYGKLNLMALAGFGDHVLVADAGFPDRHAWMVRAALEGTDLKRRAAVLELHPGARAQQDGVPLSEIPGE